MAACGIYTGGTITSDDDITIPCFDIGGNCIDAIDTSSELGGETASNETLAPQLAVKTYVDTYTNSKIGMWAFSHQEAQGVAGGDTVSGAWTTLPINTSEKTSGASSPPTLDANRITFPKGLYHIHMKKVYSSTGVFRIRLYSVTDAAADSYGFSDIQDSKLTREAEIDTIIGSSVQKVYEFQYWTDTITVAGLGRASNITDVPEVYSRVTVARIDDGRLS